MTTETNFERLNSIDKKPTCFDCKNHFMSDCYLECQIHNRINQSDICKDFEEIAMRYNVIPMENIKPIKFVIGE